MFGLLQPVWGSLRDMPVSGMTASHAGGDLTKSGQAAKPPRKKKCTADAIVSRSWSKAGRRHVSAAGPARRMSLSEQAAAFNGLETQFSRMACRELMFHERSPACSGEVFLLSKKNNWQKRFVVLWPKDVDTALLGAVARLVCTRRGAGAAQVA